MSSEALSRSLLLGLTVALTHGPELSAAGRVQPPGAPAFRRLVGRDRNLIFLRSRLFGLMAVLRLVRARGLPPERWPLRAPFFGQH